MAKPAERRAARLAAVQALYQMDVSGKGVVDALAEFEAFWIGREVEGVSFQPAEHAFFRDILSGVVREQRAIDGRVDAALAARSPSTSTSRATSTARTSPASSTPCSMRWRARSARANSTNAAPRRSAR